MSWSFYGCGKPSSLAAKIGQQLSNQKCSEPEETIKAKVSEIVSACLLAYPEGTAVDVKASGSQSSAVDGKAVNSLKLEITPLYGFVE